MKTAAEIEAALADALEAYNSPIKGTPSCGCGRAYVALRDLDKTELRRVGVAAKKCGLMWLRKAYGTGGNVIYVGYDNASGIPLAKANAMVSALEKHDIKSYVDAVAD